MIVGRVVLNLFSGLKMWSVSPPIGGFRATVNGILEMRDSPVDNVVYRGY